MKAFKSALEKVSSEVFQARTLEEGKAVMENFLSTTGIKEEDKRTMKRNVEECRSLLRLQNYVCNSLLKFEGMSTKIK